MTNELAIEVHNLSKKFYIGHLQNQSQTLLESFVRGTLSPIRRVQKLLSGQATGAAELDQEMWALRDVSFQVKKGEVLGIIGKNGAGKSTLLKVLSQITAPTEGKAILRGQVGSLLEVGTGFHNELTGRENVYLNGSILGLTRQQINKQFDEIVSFAGVERFIDTPVKHYSSGMSVRLAFAVAAHLDTEILLTDEVLSVGDYAFQKKSLGKMRGVTKSGRTVLFVSHQLDMVREICDRTIFLADGQIKKVGKTNEIVDYYINSISQNTQGDAPSDFTCMVEPDREYQLLGGRLLDEKGNPSSRFDVFSRIFVEIDYIIRSQRPGLVLSMIVHQDGTPLFTSFDTDTDAKRLDYRTPGKYSVKVEFPSPLLKEGTYSIDLAISLIRGAMPFHYGVEKALTFVIDSTPTTNYVSFTPDRAGKLVTQLNWQHQLFEHHVEP